ncbi:helix-turn-helix domain-containing protein [Actinocorallia longicatena]
MTDEAAPTTGRGSSPGGGPGWAGRRADARRNHERIVRAAFEVFAEKGLEATVPEVAERAGVGKATVYRSYPTKADLVAAVALHQLEWLQERLAAALAEDDAGPALREALADMLERLAGDCAIAEALGAGSPVDAALQTFVDLLGRVVAAARDQGAIRADVTVTEVRVLFGGCSVQLTKYGERDPAVWRHYGELVFNALRPA